MRRLFVDTSAFVALRNRSEREHEPVRRALASLIAQPVGLFTSNYVVAETYTAFLVRVSRSEAIESGRRFREGEAIEVVRVDEEVEEDAWQILEVHEDKRWSYVDATSFALMDREATAEAFTFDHHFVERGLRVYPSS